jgi:hypothetical protein
MMRLNMAKAMGLKYEFHYPTESLIACLVWCAIFIFGSYWILKKRLVNLIERLKNLKL